MAQDLVSAAPGASLTEAMSHLRTELERAVKFDSVKAIRDQAEALRSYAKSIGAAQSALNSIAEIKLRAERRMGREIASFTLNVGGRPPRTGDSVSPVSPPTLSELGIHKKWSQRWQTLARMPAAEFETYLIGIKRSGEELTAAGLYRAARKLEKDGAASAAADAPGNCVPVRRQLRALERAWLRASDAARRAFVEKHLADLAGRPAYERNVVPLTVAGR
jgi:hypothetical protein